MCEKGLFSWAISQVFRVNVYIFLGRCGWPLALWSNFSLFDFLEANYSQISLQNVYTDFFSQELIISWCSNKVFRFDMLSYQKFKRMCSKIIRRIVVPELCQCSMCLTFISSIFTVFVLWGLCFYFLLSLCFGGLCSIQWQKQRPTKKA